MGTDYLGNPRYSFEAGDTIRLQDRCGLVLTSIAPGVLVEWWDGSRAWIEMGKLENLSTGRPAMEIPAEQPPAVMGSNITMNAPPPVASAEFDRVYAHLRGVLHSG